MSAPDPTPWWEKVAQAFERPAQGLGLEDLARRLNPKTVWTPALALIAEELERLIDTPDGRLIISMPPQEGKTALAAKVFLVALLRMRPDTRIIVASYGHDLARRNSRAVRDAFTTHPELGYRIRADLAAQNEWQLDGHEGGVYAAGVGSAATGRPADLLLVDDPVKDREEADSEVMRNRAWTWWTDTASTRLAPGAPVCVIQTRWHEDDLSGRMLKAEDKDIWRVVNIPALADHDPQKGESDPLGRDAGEYLESARGRTPEQWAAIRKRVGSRTWLALYQGRPTASEGNMFKRDWWQFYDYDLWLSYENGTRWVPGDVEICISVDCAFKDLSTSDYVVLQVWMRRNADVFLLDQVRERLSFTDTCTRLRTLSARWPQAVAKYIEDKANGPAVMNSLRKTVPGMIPIEPEGSKVSRAAAVTPYVEAGNVWLPAPEIAPWVDDFIEELAAFPTGTHDDQVDGFSQAINRLLLAPWIDLGVVEPEEFDDEHRVHISRY